MEKVAHIIWDLRGGVLALVCSTLLLGITGEVQDLPSQVNDSRTEEHAGKISIVTMKQHPQLWFS